MPREASLGSVVAFSGTVGKLYERTEKEDLEICEKLFQCGSACTGNEIAQYFFGLRDTVMVYHSPAGCPQWLTFLNVIAASSQAYEGLAPEGLKYVSTDLTTNEVVYGGEERLREVLLWVDKTYKPKLMPIFSTCAAGTVGDDIEGVISDIENQVNAKMLPLHCGGFRSQCWASAFDFGSYALVSEVMEEPQKKEQDLLNIPVPWTCMAVELEEMRRVIARLGIRVRFYPRNATIEDVRKAPEAAGNLMYCVTFGFPWCAYMQDRFGTPYEEVVTQNIGIEVGGDWLRAAAKLTGIGKDVAEEIIGEEEELLMKRLKPLKERLKGKKVYVTASHARGPAIARLCADLGMEVVALHFYHWDKLSLPILKGFVDVAGPDVPVVIGDTNAHDIPLAIEQYKPDLYFGDGASMELALKMGVPAMPIQTNPSRGAHSLFTGAYNLAKEMVMLLDYPQFARKLWKHSERTFRKDFLGNKKNLYETTPKCNVSY